MSKSARQNKKQGSSAAPRCGWRNESEALVPHLTIERAMELVGIILAQDDDEQARALVELVTGIGYETDSGDRDRLALWTTHEAYSTTLEFSRAVEAFARDSHEREP